MTPIERMLDRVEWVAVPPPDGGTSLPYATHVGELSFVGSTLRCYQLNNGMRVFDADDIAAFLCGDTEVRDD